MSLVHLRRVAAFALLSGLSAAGSVVVSDKLGLSLRAR
jgi:hypothetical protein